MHKNYDGEMLLYPGPIFQYSINIYRCEAGWLAKWLDGCLAGWLVGAIALTLAHAVSKHTYHFNMSMYESCVILFIVAINCKSMLQIK